MNINDIELKNIKGFIAQDEALRLYELAKEASLIGPCLEIGSYCGKTASYIGMGCRENGCVLFSMGKPGTLPVLIYIFLSRPFCPSRVFAIIQQKSFSKIREVSLYFHNHLLKMATLPNLINTDLSRGFTVSQVAEKHGWTEPMVWSLALEDKEDIERFKKLGWGLRTWGQWEWNDCDRRFGDDWPGRIPAQLIAHILFYFSKQNNLILDPMAGGGVTADTCLALNRRCWTFEMTDRPDERPEIEPHTWTLPAAQQLSWPVSSKEKPDLIIFDPPYFDKKAADYAEKSISGLPKKEYLEFLEAFFALLKQNAKKTTRLAFINADWRDFQNKPAAEESGKGAILIDDYIRILNKTGWQHTHIIQAPKECEPVPNYFGLRFVQFVLNGHLPDFLSGVHDQIQVMPVK